MKGSKLVLTAIMFPLMVMTLMTSYKKENSKTNPSSKICDPGYEGENCDKLISAHITGNYHAVDKDTNNGIFEYNPLITLNGSITAVSIFYFGDFFTGAQLVVANVTRTGDFVNFTISSQKPDGSFSVSGSGAYSISNKTITIRYVLSNNSGSSNSYTGDWTKL